MKKRGLAMLLALSMGVGMLSGCSTGSSGAGAGRTTAAAQSVSEGQSESQTPAEDGTEAENGVGTEDGAGAESQTSQAPEGAVYAAGGYEGNQEELAEMLQHFGDQEFIDANLSPKKQQLAILATLVATMSYPQVKEQTGIALDQELTPLEIREAIYQTASYAGYQKAINAMAYADEMFAERGIEIPLESQATVTDEDRYEKGLEAQRAIFGPDFAAITEDMSESMKRRVSYVSEFSFGDFMTRTGLDEAERELIVLCVIASLGGADSQLSGHAAGSLAAGNTGDELLAAVLLCMPYNGFPRGLNAYATVNDAILQAEQNG